MLSSGFTNAPITKRLLIAIVSCSVALSIFDAKHRVHIQVQPHLWQYGQFSRVLLWQVAGYANSTETLFAAILAYHMRVVERLWGSRKTATFLLIALAYTTILTPLLLACVVRPLSLNSWNYLPSGLTATLFALLAQYHATIPHTFKYRIATTTQGSPRPVASATTASVSSRDSKPSLTLLLSDKSTTYLVAAQLALSQFPFSLLPAAVGWAVGVAWRDDLLVPAAAASASRGWRVPAWMVGEKEVFRRTAATSEDSERYETLRRRLDEASAAAGSTSSAVDAAATERGQQRRVPLLDRFRGTF